MVRRSRIPRDEDKKQYLATARAKARRNWSPKVGDKDAYFAAAAKNARIDWDRRSKAEHRRRKRTVSIEDLLHEPGVPGFLYSLIKTEFVNFLLHRIEGAFAEILRLHYLEERDVDEVAGKLCMSKRATRRTIRKALEAARTVPRR